MTIGTVRVAPSAACRAGSGPWATSTLTFDRTSSAASADSALKSCSTRRKSTIRFWHRRSKPDPRIRGQPGLIDLVEELDALVGDVLLQALDRLCDRIGALHPDDVLG